ncbi:hypothetical protein L1887_29246 [Cichorium endivia]|nr:hypothetical protein L1887_29246 [Cichorium endivia]
MENQKLNDELKKKQKEIDALRKENLKYKDQITVLKSEKSRVSENLKLEDELKKKQSELDAMRKLNAELEKKQAERTIYENRSTDLHDRVLKLEQTAKELMISEGSSSFILEDKQHKNPVDENCKPTQKEDNKKRTEPKFQDIIEIEDDDDDDELQQSISTLKRKRQSDEIKNDHNSDFVSNIQTETQATKNLQDSHNSNPLSTPCSERIKPRNLLSSMDSCDSTSDPNIKNIDEAYKSILAKLKMKKGRWRFKADMLEEFDKDDELCMNAVCALHRQSRTVLAYYDKSRIIQLAQLVTDGDPQQKVKKSASELDRCDVYDCRRLARMYSTNLFNIYQKKDDPFFPPS